MTEQNELKKAKANVGRVTLFCKLLKSYRETDLALNKMTLELVAHVKTSTCGQMHLKVAFKCTKYSLTNLSNFIISYESKTEHEN